MSSKSIIKSMKSVRKQCSTEKDFKIDKVWNPTEKFHELQSALEDGTVRLYHCDPHNYYVRSFDSPPDLMPYYHINYFDDRYGICDKQYARHRPRQHMVSL